MSFILPDLGEPAEAGTPPAHPDGAGERAELRALLRAGAELAASSAAGATIAAGETVAEAVATGAHAAAWPTRNLRSLGFVAMGAPFWQARAAAAGAAGVLVERCALGWAPGTVPFAGAYLHAYAFVVPAGTVPDVGATDDGKIGVAAAYAEPTGDVAASSFVSWEWSPAVYVPPRHELVIVAGASAAPVTGSVQWLTIPEAGQ